MFAFDMKDETYRTYRKTLDILNNSYPDLFRSVERLIRFTRVPQKAILDFQETEKVIVRMALENQEFMLALQEEKVTVCIKEIEYMIRDLMESHPDIRAV